MNKDVKTYLTTSLLFVTIIFMTDCVASAQSVLSAYQIWVKTNCPSSPEALVVHHGYLFAGSQDGIVRSSDDANTWKIVDNGLVKDIDPPPIISLCSFGNKLFAGGDYSAGTSLSTDDGDNWKPYGTSQRVISFIVHNNYIFGASSSWSMIRSTDSGATWQFPDTTYGEMTFMHYNDNISCVSVTANNDFVFGGSDDGMIYRSSNNGDHWVRVFTDSSPSAQRVDALGSNGSTIVAQVGDSLIRSTDNGDHWELVQKRSFGIRTFITYNNIIFAGGYFGVFYSSDNGANWNKASDGLPDSIVVDAFAIQDGYLFAGAYVVFPTLAGGVWKIPLLDFAEVKQYNNISSLTSLGTNYPNPFSSSTIIPFTIGERSYITLEIFDALGRNYSTLASGNYNPGYYEAKFNAESLSAGIYLVRLRTDKESFTKTLEMVK
jgi:photosystem II stability/assembly factor-like uncharacterized protein